jgi:hypothetical protein
MKIRPMPSFLKLRLIPADDALQSGYHHTCMRRQLFHKGALRLIGSGLLIRVDDAAVWLLLNDIASR